MTRKDQRDKRVIVPFWQLHLELLWMVSSWNQQCIQKSIYRYLLYRMTIQKTMHTILLMYGCKPGFWVLEVPCRNTCLIFFSKQWKTMPKRKKKKNLALDSSSKLKPSLLLKKWSWWCYWRFIFIISCLYYLNPVPGYIEKQGKVQEKLVWKFCSHEWFRKSYYILFWTFSALDLARKNQ